MFLGYSSFITKQGGQKAGKLYSNNNPDSNVQDICTKM